MATVVDSIQLGKHSQVLSPSTVGQQKVCMRGLLWQDCCTTPGVAMCTIKTSVFQ